MTLFQGECRIIMVDDDPEDCLMVKEAFEEIGFRNDLLLFSDGEELFDYLLARGADAQLSAFPSLILLDLNLPKKDGRELLRELRRNPDFNHIPVIVLTTSHDRRDIDQCYKIGANSYITKPSTFNDLIAVVACLAQYWLKTVKLPL